MDIRELEISEWVADKIASKHGIIAAEVYEVFWNDDDPLLIRRSQKVQGTYVALGRTFAGRYLMIAFRPLVEGRVKVLTARDMDQRERPAYRE